MNRKTLILAGDDAVTTKLLARGLDSSPRDAYWAVADRSLSLVRLFRLLSRGSVRPDWLARQLWSRSRQRESLDANGLAFDAAVRSIDDLARFLDEHPETEKLVAFRASLVLPKRILSRLPCFNLHCAKLPEYAGLGAISRALRAGDLHQAATLHRMAPRVDAGEVISTEPFALDPKIAYWKNELEAYLAGARLLARFLAGET